MIRLDAADAAQVIDQIGRDVPLPPGANFDALKATLPDEPTEMSESGLRDVIEYNAECQWTGHWLRARERDDADQMESSIAALEEFQRQDPNAWLALRIDGMRQGTPESFLNEYAINCTNEVPNTAR